MSNEFIEVSAEEWARLFGAAFKSPAKENSPMHSDEHDNDALPLDESDPNNNSAYFGARAMSAMSQLIVREAVYAWQSPDVTRRRYELVEMIDDSATTSVLLIFRDLQCHGVLVSVCVGSVTKEPAP